jgi:hypothetical protein
VFGVRGGSRSEDTGAQIGVPQLPDLAGIGARGDRRNVSHAGNVPSVPDVWDALGQNEREVRLGRIREGKIVPAGDQVSLGAMPRAFILR